MTGRAPCAAAGVGAIAIAAGGLGGRIGRIMVRVTDPVTQDPLYVAAHDLLYGYLSQWYSPLVRAWARPVVRISQDSVQGLVDSLP